MKKTRIEKCNILTLLENHRNAQIQSQDYPLKTSISIEQCKEDIQDLRQVLSSQSDHLKSMQCREKQPGIGQSSIIKCGSEQYQMRQTVQRFLMSYVPHMNFDTIEMYIEKIVESLASQVKIFGKSKNPTELEAIFTILEANLPSAIMLYSNRDELYQLCLDILSECNWNSNDTFSFEELVDSIIMETRELVPVGAINYSDIFLSDFLHALLGYCELNDILHEDYIGVLIDRLGHSLQFYPMRVNIENVLGFLKNYDLMTDESLLRQFVRKILTRLISKYHVNNGVAELIS